MTSTHRCATHGSTPFTPMSPRGESIRVNLVMVPPHGRGTGFGHTESGACVQFTNTTKAMHALFHRLRAAGREPRPPAVQIDSADWKDVTEIDRSVCPIHMLPEIEAGSEVAFAPY